MPEGDPTRPTDDLSGGGRLPPEAGTIVGHYLGLADRHLPGRVTGFHVVGSTALGGYRHGRSDLDVVAVVDEPLTPADLRALRRVHLASALASARRTLPRRQWMIPGNPNATWLRADQLALPRAQVHPEASHTGERFSVGAAFDVNPVGWATLARHGIAVRGAAASTLGMQVDDGELRHWNRQNLEDYWRPWADRVLTRRTGLGAGWRASWGALGAPRLHRTIATGDIITKEEAGAYALATFDERWHPLLHRALAHRTAIPPARTPAAGAVAALNGDARRHAREAAGFVHEVVRSARVL